MKRAWWLLVVALLLVGAAQAQDGLNLPTDLFILTNDGVVQRFGVGAAGVRTVSAEGVFVLDFAAAPDGEWLAQRTEQGLGLVRLSDGETLPVEDAAAGLPPLRGRGDTVAWSPDGGALAYTTLTGARVYFRDAAEPAFADLSEGAFADLSWSPGGDFLAASTAEDIWWIYRREGVSMVLTSAIPYSAGIAWSGSGNIVFAPQEGGLLRMDLTRGNAQTLLLDNTWVYALPYAQPDGTLSVFGRQKDDATIAEGSGRLITLAADRPAVTTASETPVDLNDVSWAPGGELLVAFRGGVLALIVPQSGQGLTLPVADAVAYGWGAAPPAPLAGFGLPADALFLTRDADGLQQVWRLARDGSLAVPLTRAKSDVTAYALAPGGTRIAYATGGEIWLQPLGAEPNAEPSALENFAEREVRQLTFSPDGRQLAFSVISAPEAPEGGIYLRQVESEEQAELLLRNGPPGPNAQYMPPFYRQPQFAPNIDALLVAIGASEMTTFAILDLRTRLPMEVGAFDEAIWLRDGRVLAYGTGIGVGDPPPAQPVILFRPTDGTRTDLTSFPYPARITAVRQIDGQRVRLLLGSARMGPNTLRAVDVRLDTGAQEPLGVSTFLSGPVLSANGGFAIGHLYPSGPLTFLNLTNNRRSGAAEPPETAAAGWFE